MSPLAINQLSRSLRSPLTKPQIDQPSTDKPSVASVDPIVGSPHPAPRRRTTRTRARSSDDLAPGGPYLSVRRWPAAGGLDRGGASRKARPRLPAFFGLGAVGACASDQWPRPPAIIGGGGRVESAPPHLARLCLFVFGRTRTHPPARHAAAAAHDARTGAIDSMAAAVGGNSDSYRPPTLHTNRCCPSAVREQPAGRASAPASARGLRGGVPYPLSSLGGER